MRQFYVANQELISHFQTETLAQYNAELETNLAYPYK